jgi:hypothetical protein
MNLIMVRGAPELQILQTGRWKMFTEYSIGLAILDFLPNIAFLVGAYFLVRIALIVRGVKCSRMVMAGTLLVALGGILKATWKIIYASGGPDIQPMSQAQFALAAPGFLAMLVVAILIARKQTVSKARSLPVIAAWKIPLLFLMTIASLGAYGIMSYISFKRKATWAAVGFIVAFVGVLVMGGLASADQSVGLQWIEEAINSIGQMGFAAGAFFLYGNFKSTNSDCY